MLAQIYDSGRGPTRPRRGPIASLIQLLSVTSLRQESRLDEEQWRPFHERRYPGLQEAGLGPVPAQQKVVDLQLFVQPPPDAQEDPCRPIGAVMVAPHPSSCRTQLINIRKIWNK